MGPNVMEMSSALVGPNISPHYISITLPHYISNVITFATILVGSPPDGLKFKKILVIIHEDLYIHYKYHKNTHLSFPFGTHRSVANV